MVLLRPESEPAGEPRNDVVRPAPYSLRYS